MPNDRSLPLNSGQFLNTVFPPKTLTVFPDVFQNLPTRYPAHAPDMWRLNQLEPWNARNDPVLTVASRLMPHAYSVERLKLLERLERLERSGPNCCLTPHASCLMPIKLPHASCLLSYLTPHAYSVERLELLESLELPGPPRAYF